MFKKFVIPFVRLRGERYYCNKINEIAQKVPYGSTKYVGAITWGLYGAKGEVMALDEYEKQVFVEFEGYQMPTYSCYKSYLTNMYGDYMRPVQEPTCHGSYLLLDTTKDYSLHIESLRKSYSHEKFIKRWKHIFDKILYYLSFGHTEVPKR